MLASPYPGTGPGQTEPQAGAGVRGRDAGGIASPANASAGGQVSAGPVSEAAPPRQHSWSEVPGSPGWEAKSEHDDALLGVPLATENPVLSPHISPRVPSMAQLVQLCSLPAPCPVPGQAMLQLRRGQCRSRSGQRAGTPHRRPPAHAACPVARRPHGHGPPKFSTPQTQPHSAPPRLQHHSCGLRAHPAR